MKITQITIKNFRAYRQETVITFEDLTVLIGKNDIGKSTVLEALDIFFGNRSLDFGDKNISAAENENIVIGVAFKDFPETIIIDETVPTSLEDEYLLNQAGNLEIHKEYKFGSKVTNQTYLISNHPTNEKLADLLTLKITELKKRAADLEIDKTLYDGRKSSEIREQIRFAIPEKTFEVRRIKIDEEGLKNIWEKLNSILPIFALFQSDRPNSDKDSEIQDPMKIATREVLKELEPQLGEIKEKIEKRIEEIAQLTVEKVAEMNKEIATNLKPFFPKEIKWDTLFSPILTSDGVPLAKRGSGVRRLVLINFFRAEAERKMKDKNATSVIYAIEEPETSQHPNWQKELIKALLSLSNTPNTQVIMTTHSPELARLIPVDCLRYIRFDEHPKIEFGTEENLVDIVKSLGVLPNITENKSELKLIVCVEGPSDVNIFSHFFSLCGFDIENDLRVVIIPLGGATLDQWVNRQYLKKLNLPEYHIYDNDVAKYQTNVDTVNARGDNSSARLTEHYEIENYIHPNCIKTIYNLDVDVYDTTLPDWKTQWKAIDVPSTISPILRHFKQNGYPHIRGESADTLKSRLGNIGFSHMTRVELEELEVLAEIELWLSEIQGRI
jgi:putative ATP-dependent endonuclease of the OLD family